MASSARYEMTGVVSSPMVPPKMTLNTCIHYTIFRLALAGRKPGLGQRCYDRARCQALT